MTITSIQILALVLVVAYLCSSTVAIRRRNARSWNSLVARLRPGWDARELIKDSLGNSLGNSLDDSLGGRQTHLTLYRKLKRIRGAQGLWAMYENAGVMLEMADYAASTSDELDMELVEFVRKEAMQTRVQVLEVLGKYAVGAVNESICTNVLRAESAYAEMTLRITELLEVSAPEALPAFIGSM